MNGSHTIAVVVPTWRRASWLDRCLEGIQAQTLGPDEVVVVGRPEDSEARSVVQSRAAASLLVRWVDVDRPGHVAPVIRGIERVTSDIVAFLDDDVVPEDRWLASLVEPFDDDLVACVGGRVISPGVRARVRADAGRIRWYGRHVGNVAMVEAPSPLDVDGVMECNWAWRRTALDRVRFDARLDFDDASMYGLDLTWQAREHGFRVVYQPAAVVVNASAPRDPALDRNDRAARTFSYSRNYSLIATRHLQGFRRAAFWSWWLLIGERGSYGLATGLIDLLSGRAHRSVVTASFRGKLSGARAWLER